MTLEIKPVDVKSTQIRLIPNEHIEFLENQLYNSLHSVITRCTGFRSRCTRK
ncbi:MAG: hypothetical protein H7Z37_02735 [Pyrinomonadaceae bacterium]|nr:hypothetical protein [Pyrinomonadaceae bacterium]